MPQLRISIQMGGFTMGGSESWVTPNTSYTLLAGQISDVLRLRAALLHPDAYFQGVRISQFIPISDPTAARRRSIMLPPGKQAYPPGGVAVIVPETGRYAPGSVFTAASESPYRASLQMQCTYDTDRVTSKYLEGVPTAASSGISGAYSIAGAGSWDTALSNYINYLTTHSWAIQAKDRTASNPPRYIQFIRNEPAPGRRLGLIFTDVAPDWAGGTRVELQNFRPPKGTRLPTINGGWTIDARSDTDFPGLRVFYLRGSEGITETQVRPTPASRVYRYLYTTYPVQYINAVRVVWHKRGKPVTAPRGRRLSRPTLDP